MSLKIVAVFVILVYNLADMATILSYIQIILSVILVVLILMQQSEAGLGSAFGGGGDGGSGHRTRRGSDRIIFIATIVVGALFALSAIISFLL